MGAGRVGKFAVYLISVIFLISCAGTPEWPTTQEEVLAGIELKSDPDKGTWGIYTPSYFGGAWRGWRIYIHANGKGKIVNTYEIHVVNALVEWALFERAVDVDGVELDFHIQEREFLRSEGGIYMEHVSVSASREYLELHTEKPVQFTLYGETTNNKRDIILVPHVILGFLRAVDRHVGAQ